MTPAVPAAVPAAMPLSHPTASFAALAVLVIAALLLAAFGVWFARRQRNGAMGGAISIPKVVWLCSAIFFWLVLCPVVAVDGAVHGSLAPSVSLVLGAFGAFFWARAIAEMVMLYVWKNWIPPYGIGHDVLCIVLVVALGVREREAWATLSDPIDRAGLLLVVVLLASLVIEIVHAVTFFVAIEGKTRGEDGIWFADEHDPRFIAINRNTRIGNVVVWAGLLAFLIVWAGLWPVASGGAP